MTLNWNGVDPNGPSPTHYTVSRTDDHGGGPTVVCPDVNTSTSCNDNNGIQDNGIIYTYSVVAWNDAGADQTRRADFTSAVATAPGMRASRQPAGVSNLVAAPTGADGTAQLTFDVGKSYGIINTVYCTVNGSACTTPSWSFSTDGQASVTETVTGLTNGSQSNFILTACNDTTSQQHDAYSGNPCRTANAVSTITYGQFGLPSVSIQVSGNVVSWNASGNADGRNVNVIVTDVAGFYNKTFTPEGPLNWNVGGPSESFTIPPSTNDSVQISVTDTGTQPTQRQPRNTMSTTVQSAPLTISGNPGCSGPATTISCSWPAAVDKGSVTYYVSWAGGSNVPTTCACYSFSAPQDGAGHSFSVYAKDDTGHMSNTVSTGYTDPPVPSRGFTVQDAFLGGTCVQNSMTGGPWYHQVGSGSNPTCSTAGYWVTNGTTVQIVCAASGANYQVKNNGKLQTWNWYGRTTDNHWVRAAAIWNTNDAGGNPGC